MFDFFAGIFDPIVDWVSGSAGEAVGAVTGAVLQGAVVGAISGAGVALIKGEDVFKGALKGAALGGVVAGVASSLLQMSGMENFTAEKQLKAMGFDEADSPGNVVGDSGLNLKEISKSDGVSNWRDSATGLLSKGSDKGSFWSTDSGGKVMAGVGQGLAQGAGNYLSAKETAAANKESQLNEAQIEKDKIAANQPSKEFAAKTANLKVRSWWEDRIRADTDPITSGGILKGVA